MYFALGQVAGSNLHCLFDIKANTAIGTLEQTVMQRNPQNAGLLEVYNPRCRVTPWCGSSPTISQLGALNLRAV